MVKKSQKGRVRLSKKVSSVAHPTRQAIIGSLEAGAKTTAELETELGESRYNLYHHLKTLADDGFINESIAGRVKTFALAAGDHQMDDLTRELEELSSVQQTMVAQSPRTVEAEVSGELLNTILAQTGQASVDANKSYQILIVDKSKKKGKKR